MAAYEAAVVLCFPAVCAHVPQAITMCNKIDGAIFIKYKTCQVSFDRTKSRSLFFMSTFCDTKLTM